MCLQIPDPEADRNVTASLTLGQGKSAPPFFVQDPVWWFWTWLECTSACFLSPASAGRVCGSCLGRELRREDSLAHWPEPTPPGQVLLSGSPGTPSPHSGWNLAILCRMPKSSGLWSVLFRRTVFQTEIAQRVCLTLTCQAVEGRRDLWKWSLILLQRIFILSAAIFLRMPLNHPRGRSLDSWFILQQKLRSIKIKASCWVLKFHYPTSPYYRYLFSIHMRPLGREDLPWYLYSEYSVTCLPWFHLFLGENFPFLCEVDYVSKLPKRSGISLLNSDDHLSAS